MIALNYNGRIQVNRPFEIRNFFEMLNGKYPKSSVLVEIISYKDFNRALNL